VAFGEDCINSVTWSGRVWKTGRVMMTGENRSTLEDEPHHGATVSTTDLTWAGLGFYAGFRGERPATNCLIHGTGLDCTAF